MTLKFDKAAGFYRDSEGNAYVPSETEVPPGYKAWGWVRLEGGAKMLKCLTPEPMAGAGTSPAKAEPEPAKEMKYEVATDKGKSAGDEATAERDRPSAAAERDEKPVGKYSPPYKPHAARKK